VAIASLLLSHELKQNLFLEASLFYRKQTADATITTSKNSVLCLRYPMEYASAGFRFLDLLSKL
jgi:hypothetical protein